MSNRVSHTIALICAALLLVLIVVHRMLETPLWNYNGSRLMPSFAVAHGINYYVLIPPGGPLYNSLYGPLVSLVYLPATLFATPNSAVLAGSAITVLLCFGAAAMVHFMPSKTARGPIDVLAFLALGFLMCYLEPLKYSCFNIHADGPGLALGAVACAVLYAGGALPISALCAVLAIFCKQTFLPVPIALVVYVWARAGRTRAFRYLLWLAAAAALVGGAAILAAGPARLYHCLIWIPAHHPWNESSRIVSAIQAMRSFIRVSTPVPVLLLACAVYAWLNRTALRSLVASRSAPLLLAGIALLPFSIAGRAKAGGDVNSLSFALFFLACGLTVLLADVARDTQNLPARRLAIAVLVAIALPLAISEAPLTLDIPASLKRLPQAPQQLAFEYLNRHPGEAYFPWFPLAHFYSEHQFRHYAFGVADRLLAGEPVSEEEFRTYIPPNPRVIAFASDGTPQLFGFDLMKYLPDYRYQVTDSELPGWLVYGKAPQ